MSPLLDYSIALVWDAAAEPKLDSWETLCGDKRTLGGKETGIPECKPPSAGIFGVPLLQFISNPEEVSLFGVVTLSNVSGLN